MVEYSNDVQETDRVFYHKSRMKQRFEGDKKIRIDIEVLNMGERTSRTAGCPDTLYVCLFLQFQNSISLYIYIYILYVIYIQMYMYLTRIITTRTTATVTGSKSCKDLLS